jgi:hypothetical protein
MVDIDLSGFARRGTCSWRTARGCGESAAISDAQYHAGQVFFLSRLQRRPHFFATAYFRDRRGRRPGKPAGS